MPLAVDGCAKYEYSTDGSAANGGMNRGRLLAGMDSELAAAVNTSPQNVVKMSYAAGSLSGTAMGTNVFWGDAAFGAAVAKDERLGRVATVEVFAYQEAGEL